MREMWWKESLLLGSEKDLLQLKMGEKVFSQGSVGDRIYFVEKGSIEIYLDGRLRIVMQAGDFFGEIAALTGLPRTGTAVALEPTELFTMEADKLRAMLSQDSELRQNFIQKLSARLFHAKNRNRSDVIQVKLSRFENFFSAFEIQELEKDELLCEEGQESQELYFMLWGSLEISKKGQKIATREAGEFVGEIACLRDMSRQASIKAAMPTAVLKCPKNEMDLLLKEHSALGRYLQELAANRLLRTPR